MCLEEERRKPASHGIFFSELVIVVKHDNLDD